MIEGPGSVVSRTSPPRIPSAAIIIDARKKAARGEKLAAALYLFQHINDIFRLAEASNPDSLIKIALEENRYLIEIEKILAGVLNDPAQRLLATAHQMRLAITRDLVKQARGTYQDQPIFTKILCTAEAIANTEKNHPDFGPLLEEIKRLYPSQQSPAPRQRTITPILITTPPPSPEDIQKIAQVLTSEPPAPPRPSNPNDLWASATIPQIPKQTPLPKDLE